LPVRSGDSWGYVNPNGAFEIEPAYASADYFVGERALIQDGKERYGYINPAGEPVIAPQFAWALPFSEGLACVVPPNEAPQYIDSEGAVQFRLPAATYAGGFHNGRARVRIDGQWGYVNPDGERVIPPQYSDARDFSGGLAAVKMTTEAEQARYGFLNPAGDTVIAPRFRRVGAFANGLASASADGEHFGYIDRQGQWQIEPRFSKASAFTGQWAAAALKRRYGLIDRQGQFVLEPQYLALVPPHTGKRFAARTREGWGYLDTKGKRITPFTYDFASPFFGDFALVAREGEYGILGARGNFRVNPQFDGCAFTGRDYSTYGPGQYFATVVSDYLDSTAFATQLLPAEGVLGAGQRPARSALLRQHGLQPTQAGDGALNLHNHLADSVLARRYGTRGVVIRELSLRFADSSAARPVRQSGPRASPDRFRMRLALSGPAQGRGRALAAALASRLGALYGTERFQLGWLPGWVRRLLTDGGNFLSLRNRSQGHLGIIAWDEDELEMTFYWQASQARAPALRQAVS
jgi:hypothetical protein